MSIKSNAFGRVTLTDEDAEKFKRQVIYGRPSEAAVASVKKGIQHSKEVQKSGRVRFTVKTPA